MIDFTIRNRGNRTSLKNFERDLIESGLLRIQKVSKKSVEGVSLEDFISDFFSTYNRNLATLDAKTGKVQTPVGRRRSSGDVFRICKYYYPNCTFVQVLKIMDRICQRPNMVSSMCYTIFKRVYRYDTWAYNGTIYDMQTKDEFGRIPGDYINL